MCGIFGIINAEKKPFDYQTFCTLGICNDERGGDSCGVFIDGKYEYGVDKEKYFADFYKKSQVLNNTKYAKIALGHCRKASVGTIDVSTAQPVIISNDNGDVEFVVIHNGTIYNYEELAKKYIPNVDITNMTDSQVMTRIFYHAGYDVLAEYNGGAAFVIVDYRKEKPEVLMFKGSSLDVGYTEIPKEERPLYVVFGNNKLIFSSISKYLRTKREIDELYTCPANKLCRVTDDCDIQEVQTYDRSKQYQFRQISYSGGTKVYYGSKYQDYNEYDSYAAAYGYGKYGVNHSSLNLNKNNTKLLIGPSKSKEKERYIFSNDDGTYFVDEVLAQGFYFIDNTGKIVSAKERNLENVHVFFFWQGIMLINKECYKFLKKLGKLYGLTEGQLVEDYPLLVHSLSPDPFKDNQIMDDKTYVATSPDSFKLFINAQWQYFMSKNCYYFNDLGHLSGSWECDSSMVKATFDDYVRMSNEQIDFASLIDEFKVY